MSSRGYRAMAGIPRLQFAHVDLLVRSFGSLQGLLAASVRRSAVGRRHRLDVGTPHPRRPVAAGGVDDRRPAGLARGRGGSDRWNAPSPGAGAGAGGARMNGTAADLRLPSCTTRLYVPGPIG